MNIPSRAVVIPVVAGVLFLAVILFPGCRSGHIDGGDAGDADAGDGVAVDGYGDGDDGGGEGGGGEAGDEAGDEGGVVDCSTDNGGCDPLVTCTDTPGGPQCGECPEPYSGDGAGGCRCRTTGLWPPDLVEPRDLPPQTNIARGASYTLDPAPNYGYCTDPGDATQLTDGQYTSGYFWTQSSTVGWSRKTPLITIDLGADRPIRGLSYNTAAGTAGVSWPTAILVFVAGPDEVFHLAGDLVTWHRRHQVPPAEGYAVHKFWTDELHTHGRYLALAVVSSPYIFVDEIEVFAGEPAWLDEPISGDVVDDFASAIRAEAVRQGAVRRYLSDMHAILEKAEGLPVSQEVRDEILCEWDSAWQLIREFRPGDDFRAVLPLDAVHRRIFSVQARLWRIQGMPELVVWQSPTWDFLDHLADPPGQPAAAIAVDLMRNEYRSAQLNITNAAPRARRLILRMEGLPEEMLAGISVSEVAWTDTVGGTPVASALPAARREDDHWVIEIPSGMTRQVWLTFHLEDLPAERYQGEMLLDDGRQSRSIPLRVQLYPFSLPSRPHLHLGGWDYTNRVPSRGITEQNRPAVIAHLVEHFVDRPWATSSVMPRGEFDATGRLIGDPDTSEFDRWLQMWPGADRYSVFLAVGDSFAGHAAGTAEFDTAVGQWMSFWADHLRAKGLEPSRLALLLVDEPHQADQDATILAWAEAVHASGAGILVWEDPTYRDMQDADPAMIAACDVLCPNRQMFLAGGPAYAQYFADRLAAGTTLEFYSCSGPLRLLDPYYYLRLQAWTAWQHGATAMYFWAFSDNGGVSSWNEYALMSARAFSPAFLDETSITDAKHMEAIREGVEDYEYLYLLQQAVLQAPGNGIDPAVIQQARDLLENLPDRVLPPPDTSIYWQDALDRTVADEARVEILQMLQQLTP